MTLAEKIDALKQRRSAIILAHNYQLPEIQDVADIVGDSLELAFRAQQTKAEVIVFCGVDFMAETAKILAPTKKVLAPVPEATCPMAHHLTPAMIKGMKTRHPEAAVVLYANSTAACKAIADVTCTSANAAHIIKSLPEEIILFGPDSNLAQYVQENVPDKTIIPIPAHGQLRSSSVYRKTAARSPAKRRQSHGSPGMFAGDSGGRRFNCLHGGDVKRRDSSG